MTSDPFPGLGLPGLGADPGGRHGGTGDVTGGVRSLLTDSTGPVNTGSGDQYNNFANIANLVMEIRRVSRRRPPGVVTRDDLDRLAARFVPPPGFDRGGASLDRGRVVMVSATPGGGGRTAALMLLHGRLGGEPTDVHELPDEDSAEPDEPDEPATPVLDPDSVRPGGRLLLDLSRAPAERLRVVFTQLGAFRIALAEQAANLAVRVPDRPDHRLDADFGSFLVRLGRPDGHEVFRRHLAADGIDTDPKVLDSDRLGPHLTTGPMRELAHLARLVHSARDTTPGGTLGGWLDQAVDALEDRAAEVAQQVGEHADGRYRALLLSAAMLSKCRPDAVLAAEQELLGVLGHPDEERPILARPGLSGRLGEIGVEQVDGVVRFTAIDYDRAVRGHFWDDFPGLRESFRDWVGRCAGLGRLTERDRELLVTRFADQALRTGRPGDLVRLAEQWSGQPNPPGEVSLAAQVLAQGLRHKRFAREFRKVLYRWSCDRMLPANRAHVVIGLCRDVLGPALPRRALVRLHHLTRHLGPAVASHASDTLVGLAEGDAFFYRILATRVVDRLSNRARPSDLDLFLRLADPGRLTRPDARSGSLLRDPRLREHLVTGWRVAMTHHPHPSCEGRLCDWLRAHAERAGPDAMPDLLPDLLLDVLVAACAPDTRRIGVLLTGVRDWLAEPTGPAESTGPADRAARHRTARRVRDLLDRRHRNVLAGLGQATGNNTGEASR